MLTALSIRDIVLIEKLDISLEAGLTVLTGETGAGKSILLDALGLALGGRGDSGLVRHGATKGVVTAAFMLPKTHMTLAVLEEQGIETEGELVIRRIQSADGPSRATINDQPVSLNLLRQIAGSLAEIHGQHADRALVDVAAHRRLIDAFGELDKQTGNVGALWQEVTAVADALSEHRASMARADAWVSRLLFYPHGSRSAVPFRFGTCPTGIRAITFKVAVSTAVTLLSPAAAM